MSVIRVGSSGWAVAWIKNWAYRPSPHLHFNMGGMVCCPYVKVWYLLIFKIETAL